MIDPNKCPQYIIFGSHSFSENGTCQYCGYWVEDVELQEEFDELERRLENGW